MLPLVVIAINTYNKQRSRSDSLWCAGGKYVHHKSLKRMIYEEDLTKEQNEFVDALEDADERMQKVFREMAKEGVE